MMHKSTRVFCILSLFSILPLMIGILYLNSPAWAQNATNSLSTNLSSSNSTNTIDTFRAQGQISSLASDTLAGRINNASENVMWVLGGDWEVNVADGNLTNFVVDITMTKIDGTAAHKHTIEKLDNASGMAFGPQQINQTDLMSEQPSSKIALIGNSTMFRGTADITTNEDIKWQAVPIHVTLFNGNIINLGIEPTKTDDHFYGLPVFGTIQSIVDENGKELVKK
ncbi:MAG: hypothetical protein R2685_06065 [Candidatus Nitrosocosmicus sp.]|nr:hypothetical protein [Candidatus Nitrosocosmicus sp.]